MSAQQLASLSRLTDSLSRATTLEAVYEASLDALESGLGVSRASILRFDEKHFMDLVAWRGLSDDYRRAVEGHVRIEGARPSALGRALPPWQYASISAKTTT